VFGGDKEWSNQTLKQLLLPVCRPFAEVFILTLKMKMKNTFVYF